jgi:hypothetical protein
MNCRLHRARSKSTTGSTAAPGVRGPMGLYALPAQVSVPRVRRLRGIPDPQGAAGGQVFFPLGSGTGSPGALPLGSRSAMAARVKRFRFPGQQPGIPQPLQALGRGAAPVSRATRPAVRPRWRPRSRTTFPGSGPRRTNHAGPIAVPGRSIAAGSARPAGPRRPAPSVPQSQPRLPCPPPFHSVFANSARVSPWHCSGWHQQPSTFPRSSGRRASRSGRLLRAAA